MPSTVDRVILVRLLRAAMRQWAAFVEVQVAIEAAAGVADGASEVADYMQDLAPEFIDCPNALTFAHVDHLLDVYACQVGSTSASVKAASGVTR